ncbi:MAG: hypothetical protein IID16_00820 [Candidatus Marinimicrobia bacterium]|nr:hypothetical protein [Candidatus Neomarinimicrobiota bacterium]
MYEIVDFQDKDIRSFLRAIERLKKRNIQLDIVADMIVLIDNNINTDDAYEQIVDIQSLGGCG